MEESSWYSLLFPPTPHNSSSTKEPPDRGGRRNSLGFTMFLLLLSSPIRADPTNTCPLSCVQVPWTMSRGGRGQQQPLPSPLTPCLSSQGFVSLSLEGPVLSSFCPLPYCLLPLPGELVLSFLLLFFPRGREERGGERRFCPRGEKRWY